MTVEAVFRMNGGIDSLFNTQLLTYITKLENTLKVAFPESTTINSIYFIGYSEHLSLLKIIEEARNLSLMLQRDVVSRQLFLTIASASNTTDKVHGSYAFGVDSILGAERTVLLDMKAITGERLESFFV
jgi:acyl carrier protein